jgi:FkbM family methyltransferase
MTRRCAAAATIAVALAASLAACGSPREYLATFLEREETLYSQGQEEELIRYFFDDRRGGFYVDVGCYDYKEISTTYYLEEHLGWSGIGVDAQARYAAGWKKHRPRSKFFAYAVTDKSGETITFLQAGGFSAAEMDTTNLKKWQKKLPRMKPRKIQVPTITMNDLLDREGVKKIDFLSMDINGAEPIALAGFDIERFAPELVHVEASAHRHEELAVYFAEHDYVRIDAYLEYDPVNWYFTPRKE